MHAPVAMHCTKENTYKNINMIWSHDKTLALIRSLKRQEVLWNQTSKSYRDRKRKATAWETIETDVSVPIDMCKRRVESLLASCRREKNKIIKSKEVDVPDEVYKPKWVYWKEFKFLRGSVEEDVDVESEIDATALENPRTAWSPSARRPPRNRRKKSESAAKPIDEQRIPRAPLATPGELRRDGDEHDAFGITVAAKLRKMDENQRLYAENIINQALYKGLTYQLTPSSEQEATPSRVQTGNDPAHQQWQEHSNYPAPTNAYVPKSSGSPSF